jgi:hypothetical protein
MVDSSLTHTFNLDFYSEDSQRRYQGTFTTKKLTIKDMTRMSVRKVQLCGGMHYDPASPGQGLDFATFQINGMIAHLEIALVEYPKWWNLDELTDIEVLSKVHEEVVSFENNFPVRGKAPAAEGHQRGGAGGGASTETGSNPAGNAPQVVAGEVQSSLEP